MPAVLGSLADSKPQVRAAALSALNSFVQELQLRDLVTVGCSGTILVMILSSSRAGVYIFGTALCKANPFMKQEHEESITFMIWKLVHSALTSS